MTQKDKEGILINIILKLSEGSDWVCEELHSIKSEFDYCEKNCNGLCKECINRLIYKRYS